MNTVQYLNNEVDRRLVQKLFVRFANKYGNLWTSRLGENGDWKGCEDDWLEELSAFTVRDAVAAIRKALVIYTGYPPTQGQLIELCLKESGVPSEDEVIKLMVARDFTHPIVKLAYDRIGGWALTNGKSEEIRAKTKAVYGDCLATFKANPETLWKQLGDDKERLLLTAPEHIKHLTREEHVGWQERLKEAQRRAEEGKMQLKDQKHPEFPEDKINIGGRNFDKEVFAEFRKYLISIPETLVLSLSVPYAYARMKFLAEIDTATFLRERGYNPNPQGEDKTPPRCSNGPQKMYKNWHGD